MPINMRTVVCLMALLAAGCTNNISHDGGTAKPVKSVENVKRGNLQYALIGGEKLNHETMPLGIMMSAHSYLQKLERPLNDYLSALDKDGAINNSSKNNVTVTIENANSDYRCVSTIHYGHECIVRLRVQGKVGSKSFSFERESAGNPTVTASSQQVGAQFIGEIKRLVK